MTKFPGKTPGHPVAAFDATGTRRHLTWDMMGGGEERTFSADTVYFCVAIN